MRFHVSGFHHEFELFVPALGRHMVYNALAAGLNLGHGSGPMDHAFDIKAEYRMEARA